MGKAGTTKIKNLGPVESSSQKKITQFFMRKPENDNNARNNGETAQQQPVQPQLQLKPQTSRTSGYSKSTSRRKTTLLKPPNANGRIDCVDLVIDSDEECTLDLTPGLAPGSGHPAQSTSFGNCNTSGTFGGRGAMKSTIDSKYIDVKEFITIVPSELNKVEECKGGGSKRKALRVKNEVEERVEVEMEKDVYENPSQKTKEDEGGSEAGKEKESNNDDEFNDSDDSTDGLIRIVSFNKILEDLPSSQSSQEADSQEESTLNYFSGNDKETQRISLSSKCSTISNSDGFSLSMQSSIFSSPTKIQSVRSSNSNNSGHETASPSVRSTPVKTPKTRVNKFSPVRHLQFKSRSFSKTPTKSPSNSSTFQKSPFRNTAVQSPLKSLWATAPVPYYLKNFTTVLNSVVEDEHNSHLLNEEDMEIIQKFHCLTKSAQCLYVRLIGRKWEWKQASALNYDTIASNLTLTLEELHTQKFLHEISEVDLDLKEVLNMLSSDKLADVCKQMNIKVPSNSSTKEKRVAFLLKNCQQQQTLTGSMSANLKKVALKEIRPAYKVTKASKRLFSRIFILYHPPQYWEQDSDKDALQLLSILLAELGRVEYPQYKVSKSQHIYKDRDDLLRFQDAWDLHSQIQAYTLSKQWEEVVDVAKESMTKLKRLLEMPNIIEFSKKLPDYLRAYVAGSLLTRVCWLGVEGFQKLRNYTDANEYLNFLLNQKIYLTHYHGRWYDRLVLNSKHLREDTARIREIIQTALTATNVRDSYKLDLSARLAKLKTVPAKKKRKGKKKKPKRKPKRKKDREEWEESDSTSSEEDSSEDEVEIDNSPPTSVSSESFSLQNTVPERTIEGEKMPMFDREFGKSVFIGGGSGNRSLSSVEQFAMKYYESEGYNHCVHGEGAVPSTIYGLLFWPVIYDDEIPDVFHSPYQVSPLDFHFDDFRSRRRSAIEELLENLRSNWDVEVALELMERNWTDNINKLSIVNWSLFESFEQLKILVRSMGLPLIAGICDRLSQNYRYYRSGFPDLIVWAESKCRFAEVKGPGDSLSAKQRLWIDYLLSLKADVEVCHVKSVSNKRIRAVRSS